MFYSQKTILDLISKGSLSITPFDEKSLGPLSYEMHLSSTIQIVSPESNEFNGLKPKEKITETVIIPSEGFLLEPRQFIVAKTVETVYCDSETMGIFDGKASLAQIGLFTNISSTLIEPEFNSTITCELFNSSEHPIRLFEGQKIGQIFFSKLV